MKATQLVKEQAIPIVFEGFDRYGYFNTEEEQRQFFTVAVDLVLKISERIEVRDEVSISTLKTDLLQSVFIFSFDKGTIISLIESVSGVLYRYVLDGDVEDRETIKYYERYEKLLIDAVKDFSVLTKTSAVENLSAIPFYGESKLRTSLGVTKSLLLSKNRPPLDQSVTYVKRIKRYFTNVFQDKLRGKYDEVAIAARDINEIISDSEIKIKAPAQVDIDLLTASFAGEGKKVYEAVQKITSVSTSIMGYEGSITGSVEYRAMIYEYMMAMSYGKVLPLGLLGGQFGNFQSIYESRSKDGEIYGLKFLEPLYLTRSANQSEKPDTTPITTKYQEGIRNRYEDNSNAGVSTGSLMLEAVYFECLRLGDSIQSLLNKPPINIGDTSYVFNILSQVFPPSISLRGREEGVTGGVYRLLVSYKKLYALTGDEPDLGSFFQDLARLSSTLRDLSRVLKETGFKPGGIVASLALRVHSPDRSESGKKLKALGFTAPEIDQILSSTSFDELLGRFAPFTTSSDVISFFRAFELTKLIYEFGGQESIDKYIDYLYGSDPEKSLFRMLELLDRKRSVASKVTGAKYNKLIGYLITLTYAINPDELLKLNKILERNNLNLFESITLLVQQGRRTVLKDKAEISLLGGMVAQMVSQGNNTGYEFSKQLWNDLISQSAGNSSDLTGIYDSIEGITPEELHSALGGPSATSPLGQLMDGVRGGNLTTVLRYCNLLGLLYSLSPYRNSGQLINHRAEEFQSMLEVVSILDRVEERMELCHDILRSDGPRVPATYTSPLINAQNKSFEAMIGIISNDQELFNSAEIVDPPGPGNARVPNGLRMTNSLSPEEASVIIPAANNLGLFSRRGGTAVVPSAYVRFSADNLLASALVQGGRGTSGPASTAAAGGEIVTEPGVFLAESTTEYAVGGSSKVPGPNSPFSPSSSCKKFGGGANCDQLGGGDDLCPSSPYSKASTPETGYGESLVPGQENPAVFIDRPLGQSLTEQKVDNEIDPLNPQYYFSRYGLIKASREGLLKHNEMLCASLNNVYEYGACMSLLKCKKFKPPYVGIYNLPFCPTTLQGGRFIR